MGTPQSLKFDLLMNAAGEMMLVFPKIEGKVAHANLIFDADKKRLEFYKNGSDLNCFFESITDDAVNPLKKTKNVLCVEVSDGKIVDQYMTNIELK